MQAIKIAGQNVGPEHPCFIIAEAGVNHNSDINQAKKLVTVAAASGADAVKFQTFKANRMVSLAAPKAEYQIQNTQSAESQFEMLRRLELSRASHELLQKYCEDRKITFISTPFDHESVDLLDELGVPMFKVPSGETINLPLLRHIAGKNKPIILSTGMSDLGEVERAIRNIKEKGNQQLAILLCVSNYPARPQDANLRAMHTLAQAFDVPVGFSDHTLGIEVSLAAAALGACVIENHFTLDSGMTGPDHQASLEPDELAAMIDGIRTVESALGNGVKVPAESEKNTSDIARRSLYLRNTLDAGSILKEDDLIALRPTGGIPPDQFDMVLGRTIRRYLQADTAIKWSDLD